MAFWLVLLLCVVAGSVYLWRVGAQPAEHDVSAADFERLLSALVETMADGAVLVIRHARSDAFVQFVKRDAPSGPVLGFGFPDAEWSREFFGPVSEALTREGIAYDVSETGDDPVRRFLEVEISDASISAAKRVADVALEGMGIGVAERFVATLEGDLDPSAALSAASTAWRQADESRRSG